jgi:hypothetical protein
MIWTVWLLMVLGGAYTIEIVKKIFRNAKEKHNEKVHRAYISRINHALDSIHNNKPASE